MSVSSLCTGPGTVDALLGNAYQIVKEVQENLALISAVSAIAADIQQVINNLNDVESTLAAALSATGGAAMIGTSVDDVNVEEAIAARLPATTLAATGGAALIGSTCAAGSTVQVALANLIPLDTTTVDLTDIAHADNTAGKFKGRQAFNATDHKLYVSQGSTANATWRSVDGVTTITPV